MTTHDSEHQVQDPKIADIIIGERFRSLNSAKVDELAASLSLIGQLSPIIVRKERRWKKKVLVLAAGFHRLEAMKKLGAETIRAIIIEGDERQARLYELSENLHRAELTYLEHDEHVAEWVRLIELVDDQDDDNGINGQNVQKSHRGRPEGGIARAARKLVVKGKTEDAKRKNIERAMKVANIDEVAKEFAKKTGLDKERTALLNIATEKTPEAQLAKARELAKVKADNEKPRGFGQRRRKKARKLSIADKKSLQSLTKAWEKHLKAAFAKASPIVREQFITTMRRLATPPTAKGGRGKK